jgi:hypothetical protein
MWRCDDVNHLSNQIEWCQDYSCYFDTKHRDVVLTRGVWDGMRLSMTFTLNYRKNYQRKSGTRAKKTPSFLKVWTVLAHSGRTQACLHQTIILDDLLRILCDLTPGTADTTERRDQFLSNYPTKWHVIISDVLVYFGRTYLFERLKYEHNIYYDALVGSITEIRGISELIIAFLLLPSKTMAYLAQSTTPPSLVRTDQ